MGIDRHDFEATIPLIVRPSVDHSTLFNVAGLQSFVRN